MEMEPFGLHFDFQPFAIAYSRSREEMDMETPNKNPALDESMESPSIAPMASPSQMRARPFQVSVWKIYVLVLIIVFTITLRLAMNQSQKSDPPIV